MRLNGFMKGAVLAALLSSTAALAQTSEDAPVYLIADEVFLDGEDLLVATGNVEAMQGGRRLTASKITYDQITDTLTIEGPLRITDENGDVLVADSAELTDEMREGILQGARVVLDQQLQIAAAEMGRSQGRYRQMSKASVTSCQICDDGRAPLWQIRARRVIHDTEEKQIYFEDATLRFLNVPVFYAPKMRLPDPTVKRARGFLIPELVSSSTLGTGVRTPYFLPLGEHADITATPYLSAETTTLELRFRQKFRRGEIEVNAAGSRDTLQPEEFRSYLFAEGSFYLPEDFRLSFDVETVSDDAYLIDYDYSTKDRLDSSVTLSRHKYNSAFEVSGTLFETLRSYETNATQASRLGQFSYEHRLFPSALGGEVRLGVEAHEHTRESDEDIVGRDVQRVTANADWRRSWVFGPGFDFQSMAGVTAGHFDLDDDSTLTQAEDYTIPYAAATLRWPLQGRGPDGSSQILEPIIQVAWSDASSFNVPNDESTRVEFDWGNLFSMNRFPAPDQAEDGLRANIGAQWTQMGQDGSYSRLALGRVIRQEREDRFSETSGLSGLESDWLFEASVGKLDGPLLSARSLLDDKLRLAKAEAQLNWAFPRGTFNATYLWLTEDSAEDRDDPVSEWTFATAYKLTDTWTGNLSWRYDLENDRSTRAAMGLVYENECLNVQLSTSRRFTDSDNFDPTSNFEVIVSLLGFSAGRAGAVRQSCKT